MFRIYPQLTIINEWNLLQRKILYSVLKCINSKRRKLSLTYLTNHEAEGIILLLMRFKMIMLINQLIRQNCHLTLQELPDKCYSAYEQMKTVIRNLKFHSSACLHLTSIFSLNSNNTSKNIGHQWIFKDIVRTEVKLWFHFQYVHFYCDSIMKLVQHSYKCVDCQRGEVIILKWWIKNLHQF